MPLSDHDEVTRKLAMLIAGECLDLGPVEATRAFGYTKQRYFQLRTAFAQQGASALVDNTPGPGGHYRCTECVSDARPDLWEARRVTAAPTRRPADHVRIEIRAAAWDVFCYDGWHGP